MWCVLCTLLPYNAAHCGHWSVHSDGRMNSIGLQLTFDSCPVIMTTHTSDPACSKCMCVGVQVAMLVCNVLLFYTVIISVYSVSVCMCVGMCTYMCVYCVVCVHVCICGCGW